VFLSKILISVEKRYWSTKLEIAAVVWIVKKLHHMIRVSKHLIIIWTDHAVTAVIAKQTKMTTSNSDKFNLRLVRVEMYLSQFDLNIRHKSERDHIISDALSRLSCFDERKFTKNQDDNILDDIDAYVYVEILVKMSLKFRIRLIDVYNIDKEWSVLYVMLSILKISRAHATRRNIMKELFESTFSSRIHDEIEFERRNNLIYHLNRSTDKVRLCIFKQLIKKIFAMTHDEMFHAEFHRAYVIITKTLYIRRLAHHLRQYIDYCSQCLLNQTKRHKAYEALYLISFFKVLFHTIAMNFVLTLSTFEKMKKFDTLLTITNKFSKNKILISERNTWKAHDWAVSLWKYLQLCNWDLSRVIISDRDLKFRFDMWKSLFKIVEIDLLINAAYHSQIDEQSERTNQIIEIALRYLLTENSDLAWHETLSSLQQTFMNIKTFTEHSPNETLYEMNTRSQLILLNEEQIFIKNELTRDIIRTNVDNFIDFANVKAKIIYDGKHKFMTFNAEDKIYLRLHHEYFLLEKKNSKLSNQRFGSYTVKRKVDNAVYELNLSFNSRIHSVISIAQLEFAEDESDSYNRSRSSNSRSIEVKDDTTKKQSFEMKKILQKRTRKYDKIVVVQYLLKWRDWEFEHNFWVSTKDCSNFMNLIMNFETRQSATTRDWFLIYSVSHDVIIVHVLSCKEYHDMNCSRSNFINVFWESHSRQFRWCLLTTSSINAFNVYQTSLVKSIAESLRHGKYAAYRIAASTRTSIFLEKARHLSRLFREFGSSRLRSRSFCTCLIQASFVQVDKSIAYS
jgi:hypothetical protein